MTTPVRRPLLPAAALALAALATFPGRAPAQFGYGFGIGIPAVPSPTEFLNNRALNQRGAPPDRWKAAESVRTGGNAYWNNVRDFSGMSSFDLGTHRSLSDRVSRPAPRPSTPAPAPAPAAPAPPATPALSIAEFYAANGALDWPGDAPTSEDHATRRTEAEQALGAVREELRTAGKAKSQTLGLARWKLLAYGQPALQVVRSTRSKAVADVFHYYLRFLHDSLDLVPTDAASGTGF